MASIRGELPSRRAATAESRRLTPDCHHVPAARLPRNMRNSTGRKKKPWWPSEDISMHCAKGAGPLEFLPLMPVRNTTGRYLRLRG